MTKRTPSPRVRGEGRGKGLQRRRVRTPSPGSLRSPPSPHGRGKESAFAVKEEKMVEEVKKLLAKHGIKH